MSYNCIVALFLSLLKPCQHSIHLHTDSIISQRSYSEVCPHSKTTSVNISWRLRERQVMRVAAIASSSFWKINNRAIRAFQYCRRHCAPQSVTQPVGDDAEYDVVIVHIKLFRPFSWENNPSWCTYRKPSKKPPGTNCFNLHLGGGLIGGRGYYFNLPLIGGLIGQVWANSRGGRLLEDYGTSGTYCMCSVSEATDNTRPCNRLGMA